MSKIGNTYVEVLADMTKFTSEVRAKTSKGALPDAEIKVDADTKSAERSLDRTARSADHASTAFGNLAKKGIAANQVLSLAGKATSLVKWPAMISGANYAIKAINTLAAGTLALTGSLTPLAGLLAAAPALYGAMGQAAGVVALSGIKDLTDALGGNEEALKRLTPEAHRFMDQLKEFQPQVDAMKKDIQGELFGGLSKGVKLAGRNFGSLHKVLAGTASEMGHLAEKAGKLLGSKSFGRDFEKIGKTNTRLLGHMGDAGLNFASAIRHVMVAAGPFVDFLGKSVEKFSKYVNASAEAGRKNGDLAKFFDETKDLLKILGPLLGDFGKGLWNVVRAGKPLGDDILVSLAGSAKEFRNWTESASGKNAIVEWFSDAKAPLFELGRLIKAVGAAFFDVGSDKSGGLASMLKTLRTEVLPVIVDVLRSSEGFGPAFMEFATEGLTAMKPFLGANGVLTIFLKTVTLILKAFNKIIEVAPILGTALTNALTIRAGASLLGLTAGGGIYGMLSGGRGKASATSTGSKLGEWLGIGASSAAAATIAGTSTAAVGSGGQIIAGTAGGAAAGGLLGKLRAIKWGRIGGIGLGLVLADETLKEFGRATAHGDTLMEELTRKSGEYGDPGVFNALSRAVGSGGDAEAQELLEGLEKVQSATKAISAEDAERIRHLIRINDLNDEEQEAAYSLLRINQRMGKLPNMLKDLKPGALDEYGDRVSKLADGLVADFKRGGKAGKDMADKHKNTVRNVGNGFKTLVGIFRSDFNEMSGISKKDMAKVQLAMQKSPERGRKALAKTLDKASQNARESMHRTGKWTEQGMAHLQQLMEAKLRLFGFKGSITSVLKSHLDDEGLPPELKRQKGGVLGKYVKGTGSGDKVHLLAEPGEVVWNREAVKAMGGPKAADSVNKAIPRFATGGEVGKDTNLPRWDSNYGPGKVGSGSLNKTAEAGEFFLKVMKRLGSAAANWSSIDKIASELGLARGTLTGRIGQAGSRHGIMGPGGRAMATDYSGPIFGSTRGPMAEFTRKLIPLALQNKINELFYDPLGGWDVGSSIGAIGDHDDHVHVALQGGGVVPMPARLRDKIYSDNGQQIRPWEVAALAELAGLPGKTMMGIAKGESNYEPGNHAGDDGRGLFQLTPPVQSGSTVAKWNSMGSYYNPWDQARMTAWFINQAGAPLNEGTFHAGDGGQGWNTHYSGKGFRSPRWSATMKETAKKVKTKAVDTAFDIDKLPIKEAAKKAFTKMMKRQSTLTSDSNVYSELASRASDLGDKVGGKDAIDWLNDQLDALFAVRNILVQVHNMLASAVETMNNKIAKMKSGEGKKALKGVRNSTSTKIGEINTSLFDLQGTVKGVNPYEVFGTAPILGSLGGSIFDVQMAIHDAGGDPTGASGSVATMDMLKEMKYLKDLGLNYAGLFGAGGMLGAGQWGIAGELGPEAVVGPASIVPVSGEAGMGDIEVRVFMGDQEITKLVDSRIEVRSTEDTQKRLARRGSR